MFKLGTKVDICQINNRNSKREVVVPSYFTQGKGARSQFTLLSLAYLLLLLYVSSSVSPRMISDLYLGEMSCRTFLVITAMFV